MPRLPEFITFTGADDRTDPEAMADLSLQYPTEWGILFSPTRQGVENRYPAHGTRRFEGSVRLAAHLCGGWSRSIMEERLKTPDESFEFFQRFQINHAAPVPAIAQAFAAPHRAIAQCRGATFPTDNRVDWLFDKSGGKGLMPTRWPPHPGNDRLVGYAGGLAPHNVVAATEAIDSQGPYWIDMESGVRDKHDWFDLGKCRRVCEAVYGVAP